MFALSAVAEERVRRRPGFRETAPVGKVVRMLRDRLAASGREDMRKCPEPTFRLADPLAKVRGRLALMPRA